MGNIQTREEIEKANHITNEIMKYNCCLLDIGDRVGKTDYIDFITEDILEGHDVMKGVDIYGRSFIVVKAHIIYKDLFIANTFTTFFQRYKEENCWMACSQKGKHLMETEGGMTIIQLELLRDLLYNRSVKIDNSRSTRVYTCDSHIDDTIEIRLGHKIDYLLLQDTNCILNTTIKSKMNECTTIKDLLWDLPEVFQDYIFELLDNQKQENIELRKTIERKNDELVTITTELDMAKSDLHLYKQMNSELLQKSTNIAIMESLEQMKHMITRNDQINEKIDNLTYITRQLLANTQTIPIPKPELIRQTNDVQYGYQTPPLYPKARLWINTPEEDMEIDDDCLSQPKT
jgi:hypothetical protein